MMGALRQRNYRNPSLGFSQQRNLTGGVLNERLKSSFTVSGDANRDSDQVNYSHPIVFLFYAFSFTELFSEVALVWIHGVYPMNSNRKL